MSSKLSVEEVLSQLEQRAPSIASGRLSTRSRRPVTGRRGRSTRTSWRRSCKPGVLPHGCRYRRGPHPAGRGEAHCGRAGASAPGPAPDQPPAAERHPEPRPPEPFGASAVAVEANRRIRDHLPPIDRRTASDVLHRMLAEGAIRLAREGKAFHEALYTRR